MVVPVRGATRIILLGGVLSGNLTCRRGDKCQRIRGAQHQRPVSGRKEGGRYRGKKGVHEARKKRGGPKSEVPFHSAFFSQSSNKTFLSETYVHSTDALLEGSVSHLCSHAIALTVFFVIFDAFQQQSWGFKFLSGAKVEASQWEAIES